tara:strand:+ start:1329 stop:2030 length:702 start_codon:yes stop_codon:yes gene_type:complete
MKNNILNYIIYITSLLIISCGGGDDLANPGSGYVWDKPEIVLTMNDDNSLQISTLRFDDVQYIKFDLNYFYDKFIPTNVLPGDFGTVDDNVVGTIASPDDNKVQIVISGDISDGVLATVNFTSTGSIEGTYFWLTDILIYDSNNEPLYYSCQSGSSNNVTGNEADPAVCNMNGGAWQIEGYPDDPVFKTGLACFVDGHPNPENKAYGALGTFMWVSQFCETWYGWNPPSEWDN